jgi:hypothetical protein
MNKIEEYKKEKDGLEILDDIPRYAAEGWEKITDGDQPLRARALAGGAVERERRRDDQFGATHDLYAAACRTTG